MTRRAWLLDIAIAAALLVIGQLEAWLGIYATHRQGPHWAEAVLYGITATLIAFRRVNPFGCLLAITVVSLAEYAIVGAPEGFGVLMPGLIAGYSVARWETRRPAWWGLVTVVVLGVGWSLLDPLDQTLKSHIASLPWISLWIIGWLVGALVRSQLQNLEQRRAARAQRTARSIAEERNRIARELHDVIGHSVSVMTVQASAVRRRLTPDQAVEREALETVESVGREALAEMRRMVSVLRDATGQPDREPPPGLAQVDQLVEKFRSAGLPVALTTQGKPRPLPPGLDLTAYRLVQEGLTNALRHAVAPSHAEVSICYDEARLLLAVRDDGQLSKVDPEPGHGLLGMRERVAVYGGSLLAQPSAERGFELVAQLPLDAE